MTTRYDIVEVWLGGETNSIGPYQSFDAAIKAAGKRLRGYRHNAPIYTLVYESGNSISIATVRVTQPQPPQPVFNLMSHNLSIKHI